MERRTWWLVGGFGVVLAVWEAARGQPVLAAATLLVLGGLAWWMSPLRSQSRGGPTQREVEEMSEGERGVVVYWRPGCGFCERLRSRLRAEGRGDEVTWVDIWQDDAAAAYVRSVNDGDETVPTVVVDGVAHTNPPPSDVLEMLAR